MNPSNPTAGLPPPSAGGAESQHFATVVELQDAHDALLSRADDAGDSPEVAAERWSEVGQFLSRAEATGALLDVARDRRVAQSILDYWASALYRAGQTVPHARLVPFDETLAPQLDDEPCPYQGLAAFDSGRSQFFFGREGLIRGGLERIATGERLLIFVGDSGSGKSSVVLAGLVPRLAGGQAPEFTACRVVTLVPGSQPLDNLAQAVQRSVTGASIDSAFSSRVLFAKEAFLREMGTLAELLRDTGESPVVVVVDQFEELFTLCRAETTRTAFADQLLAAADAAVPGCVVLITMRTDFVDALARLPRLHERFKRARIDVGALDINELRAAIEMPASRVGLRFEPGIVDDLISTILGERAGLPLLQFTLLRLWRRRQRNRITWPTYREVGNPREALARCADAFYAALIPELQTAVRRVLLRMVRPGEGREFTSNRIPRSEVFRDAESRPRVEESLRRLSEAGLIKETQGPTPHDAQIEVAHEALVRNWPLLVDWLDEERAALRKRRILTDRAHAWQDHQRDPSYLLRGRELDDARSWEDLNNLEHELVDASLSAIDAERRAEEQRVQRELRAQLEAESQERDLETAKRQARKNGIWAATFAVLTALAIAATVWSFMSRAEAKRSKQRAEASEQEATNNLGKALRAQAEAGSQLRTNEILRSELTVQLGILESNIVQLDTATRGLIRATNELALALNKATNSQQEAETERGKALTNAQQAIASELSRREALFESYLTQAKSAADNEDYSTARSALASTYDTNLAAAVAPSRLSTRNLLAAFASLHSVDAKRTNAQVKAPLRDVAASPDGRYVAAVGEEGKAVLFDLLEKQLPRVLPRHQETVARVAFDAKGRGLVTAGSDRWVACWPLADARFTNEWRAAGPIVSLALSHRGDMVVVGGADFPTEFAVPRRNATLVALPGGPTNVTALAFRLDDELLAGTTGDGQIFLWPMSRPDGEGLRRPKPARLFASYPGHLLHAAFNPKGDELATCTAEGGVQLWDLATGRLKSVLRGHRNKVAGLAYLEGGRLLVSASWDQSLRLWDTANLRTVKVLQGHQAAVTGVAVAANQIFSSSVDGTWRTWPAEESVQASRVWSIPFGPNRLTCCALSPDAALVAVGSENGKVQCWSLAGGTNLWTHQAHAKAVSRLAFSPDGRQLATAGFEGEAKIYDVTTGTNRFSGKTGLGEVNDIAFSPDGRSLATAGSAGTATLRAPTLLRQTTEAGQLSLLGAAQAGPVSQRVPGSEALRAGFAHHGAQLLSAGADGSTWLWDPQTTPPSRSKVLASEGDSATWTEFSPDDRLIATAYRSGKLEIATNSPPNYPLVARLAGHEDAIIRLAFSPDGGQILTVGADRTLRVWDVQAQRRLCELRLPAPETERNALWDFAFLGKDTRQGEAWIGVPLVDGELVIYRLGKVYP